MKRKIIIGILLLVIVGTFGFSLWHYHRLLELKKYGVLTKAIVTNVMQGHRESYLVYYEYMVDRNKYSCSIKVSRSSVKANGLIYKKVDLIYFPSLPSRHLLLLTKDDYAGTSIPVPGSLNWFVY